jgi:hypothetical protein
MFDEAANRLADGLIVTGRNNAKQSGFARL